MMENKSDVNMILAGDLGGTKTLLGLFQPDGPRRPSPIVVRSFATPAFADLTAMISAFTADPAVGRRPLAAAAFGVAGPVLGRTARLTNVPLQIDADAVARAFDIANVRLLNDLEAMAHSVRVLADSEVEVLQAGTAVPDGNLALVAAGTGFNEAMIHRVGGRDVPSAAEAGHADWAARTEREIDLLRALIRRHGRAEVEHVVSGPGLVNIHRVTHDGGDCPVIESEDDPDAPAKISGAALDGRCRGCLEALNLFVDAYGAEAGNAALRLLATGGVFVGGGIAPKILPQLTDGRFMRAFLDKGSFRDMLSRMPVTVILNPEAGLIGASVAAAAGR